MPEPNNTRGRLRGGEQRAREARCIAIHVSSDDMLHKLEQRAFAWYGTRCYMCGKAVDGSVEWHIDHVVPLAAGGGHFLDNLELACKGCNLFKSDMDLATVLTLRPWLDVRPLFETLRLSDIPVDQMWSQANAATGSERSRLRRVAKAFARRPRNVVADKPLDRLEPGMREIVATLMKSCRDPYQAMTIDELRAADSDLPAGSALEDNYWGAAMGLLPAFGDKRRQPHPVVMPVNLNKDGRPGNWGYRLRGRVQLEDAAQYVKSGRLPRLADVYPDQDEQYYRAPPDATREFDPPYREFDTGAPEPIQ